MRRDVLSEERSSAPVAPCRPLVRELHGESVIDDYAWMRDRADPALSAYLQAERAHHDRYFERLQGLVGRLAAEAAARVPAGPEYSVRWPRGGFLYRTKIPPHADNHELLRSVCEDGPEQVLLDVGAAAAQTGFADIGVSEPSPGGALLAWSVDTDGAEFYELRIRDLRTGEDLPEVIPRTCGVPDWVAPDASGVAWSAGCEYLFYLAPDALGRPSQVWRHRLGQPAGGDVLVLDEPDQRFELELGASRSGELAVVTAASRDTTEVRVVPLDDPMAAPILIEPRRRGTEYRIDHLRGGALYVVTDSGSPEFTLMRAQLASPGRDEWTDLGLTAVAPRRSDTRLVRCDVLADHLVLTLRRGGAPLLAIADHEGANVREVLPSFAVGSIRIEHAEEYDSSSVIIAEESLIEPPAWYRLDLGSGAKELLWRKEVRGYDSARYRTERLIAEAVDGAQIPVTLAYRADTQLDGSAPCLLYGYGAYEASVDPEFHSGNDAEFHRTLPSLLDRGVVFAVAHVRGGGECGRRWWQQGRLRSKPTTFTDYLAVADWLAGSSGRALVDGSRIVSRGLSAGGLLQGAVYSRRPERWRAVVAEVPFVDCVNTMLDPSIPLTVNEWDEWGDPRDPVDHACIRSYTPYENTPAGRRPALLVTGALHDPRVGIHEPAKWVAKLRATDTEESLVLFRPELGPAGHTGPSGRSARFRYEAEIQAFVLDAMGITA